MTDDHSTRARPGRKPAISVQPGMRFGRWTVTDDASPQVSAGSGRTRVLCRCDCGREKLVDVYNITRGLTQSCGCIAGEKARERSTTHGLSKHPLIHVWIAMVDRCTNPNHPTWDYYGGRGIRVTERWMKFENFYEDVLPMWVPGLTFDRIDNDGMYEPGNFRFVDRKAQARNTRQNVLLTWNGRTMCIAEWAEELGVSWYLIRGRLRQGWPVDRALSTPVGKKAKR